MLTRLDFTSFVCTMNGRLTDESSTLVDNESSHVFSSEDLLFIPNSYLVREIIRQFVQCACSHIGLILKEPIVHKIKYICM